MKYLITLLLIGIMGGLSAQDLTINDVDPKDMEIKAFTLASSQTVKISGTGGVFHDDYRLLIYYGWVLDSDTREVVWHLFDEVKDSKFRENNGVYGFTKELKLPAGSYEVYFTGAYDNRGWGYEWTVNSFDDLVDEILGSRDREKYRWGLGEDMFITLSAPGLKQASVDDLFDKQVKKATVYFTRAENDEHFEQGFTLSASTDVRIYALGEGRKEEIFDYVWIYDAQTRKRVFEMDYSNTGFAGGADKNLKVDETVTLPQGSYIVSYRTDDSHSFEEWNSLPPDDPQFWGVTLFPATEADAGNFVPYVAPKSLSPVVEMVRVRNDELVSVGFSLEKDMDVRLLCIGEGSGDYDMVDYGWIVDASTRKTVWKMRGYKSEHAGGAGKNRRFEESVPLPKGTYIAYYITDDSHAYNSWNAASPHEEERWGLTIWATNDAEVDLISTFDAEEYVDRNVIAQIVNVGDDDYLKETFTLEKDTRVTVIAMGEGREGRLYDYGWIKNMESGRTVWEMEYYDTDHAGGSQKNRIAIETLELPKGDYRVYYETDDSHSYGDWNADPPNDPQGYGIRILIAE